MTEVASFKNVSDVKKFRQARLVLRSFISLRAGSQRKQIKKACRVSEMFLVVQPRRHKIAQQDWLPNAVLSSLELRFSVMSTQLVIC